MLVNKDWLLGLACGSSWLILINTYLNTSDILFTVKRWPQS